MATFDRQSELPGRVTTAQGDALHALLENVDLENAVVDILIPRIVDHAATDTMRQRVCMWIKAAGHDPDAVVDVTVFASGVVRLALLSEGDPYVDLQPGSYPPLPHWTYMSI